MERREAPQRGREPEEGKSLGKRDERERKRRKRPERKQFDETV